jgi:serine/arginine repetitive matrix protein 2
MDSTLPLRRPLAQSPHQPRIQCPLPLGTPTRPTSVSTIRLISAAPSAAGSALALEDAGVNDSMTSSPFVSISPPTPLAPKHDARGPRRRLVPKKSKLGLLATRKASKVQEKNDLPDIVLRVGESSATTSVGKSNFEVFVDRTSQSGVNEALMVKKKKSRAALSGLKWGTLGEVTNSAPPKNPIHAVGLKSEDKEKWWSIGKGRKETKDKRMAEKENILVDRRWFIISVRLECSCAALSRF